MPKWRRLLFIVKPVNLNWSSGDCTRHSHRSQSHYPVFSSQLGHQVRYHQYPGPFLHQQIKRRRPQQNWEAIFSCCLDETATAALLHHSPGRLSPSEKASGGRSPSTVPACKLKARVSGPSLKLVKLTGGSISYLQPVEENIPSSHWYGLLNAKPEEGTASGSQGHYGDRAPL